jgi:hypothetical protein
MEDEEEHVRNGFHQLLPEQENLPLELDSSKVYENERKNKNTKLISRLARVEPNVQYTSVVDAFVLHHIDFILYRLYKR